MVEYFLRWEDTSPRLLERVITVCWGIWKNRNVLRLGGKGQAGRTLLRSSMHLVDEFHAANELKSGNRVEASPMVVWQPPSRGHYKVNTDGAVFSNRKQAGVGVIIRDDTRDVVAVLSKKWKCPLGDVPWVLLKPKQKPWKPVLIFPGMWGLETLSLRLIH